MSDLGRVTVDRSAGSRGFLHGDTPTRTIGVMTEHMTADEVQTAIDARMSGAGYSTTPPRDPVCVNGCYYYRHPTNGVAINMTIYEPGDEILNVDAGGKPANLTVPPNHIGLWLTLYTI